MTLAEIKRHVRPGQVYDVTNHYITRTDHPAFGTTRRTVTRTTGHRIPHAPGGRRIGDRLAERGAGVDGRRRGDPAPRLRRRSAAR
jgi:hypothetical protein